MQGPPGSGTSALLRAITGLPPAPEGQLLVCGRDVTTSPGELHRLLTLVPTGVPVPPDRSALDFVCLMVHVTTGQRPTVREVRRALRLAAVPDDHLDQPAMTLRPVERLGAWLAGHRLRGAALLILDDPIRDLAVSDVPEALSLIRETVETGAATLMVTRDAQAGQAVADVLLRIIGGSVIAVPHQRQTSRAWWRIVPPGV